ncbi:hypothetical protein ACG7TL_001659 [Trametes sanguinea]
MTIIGFDVHPVVDTITKVDNESELYGYTPTRYVCIIFVVLYGLTTIIHAVQAIWSRLWWLFPTAVLAGIAELLGWSGRLWSSISPLLVDPYLMQIVTTIIAPTPFIAANFVILGHIIKRLGQQYSRLNAMWYTIIFCSCDVVALIIQALGGAKAASAVEDFEDPTPGGNVMLGGIAFQLGAICIYALLALEFLIRYHYDKPFKRAAGHLPKSFALDRNTKTMIGALFMMWIFLLIRSIYRTVELSNGWTGRIITTQVYFNVLDGAMIFLAMFTLNVFHPGILMGKADTWNGLNSSDIPQDQEKQPKDSSSS